MSYCNQPNSTSIQLSYIISSGLPWYSVRQLQYFGSNESELSFSIQWHTWTWVAGLPFSPVRWGTVDKETPTEKAGKSLVINGHVSAYMKLVGRISGKQIPSKHNISFSKAYKSTCQIKIKFPRANCLFLLSVLRIVTQQAVQRLSRYVTLGSQDLTTDAMTSSMPALPDMISPVTPRKRPDWSGMASPLGLWSSLQQKTISGW